MELKTVILKFKEEKKQSVRYDAERGGAILPSAYVNKAHLPYPYPDKLKVTVEAVQ